jgi:hypothetical protein
VLEGGQTREQALARYGAFSASHSRPFRWMLRVQRLIPRVPPRMLGIGLRAIEPKRFIDWAFGHYLAVAHPDFVRRRDLRWRRSRAGAAEIARV